MLTKEVIKKLRTDISVEVSNTIITTPYEINGPVFNEFKLNIEDALKDCIKRCFDKLLNELEYTDEKFEGDMGLKS